MGKVRVEPIRGTAAVGRDGVADGRGGQRDGGEARTFEEVLRERCRAAGLTDGEIDIWMEET